MTPPPETLTADLSALEPEQRTISVREPLPRAHLGAFALAALLVLRIYSLAAVALVVYVFVRTLRG